MNNTANKKDIFYIIVLILTFITVVVGATFALFTFVFEQEEEDASAVYTGTLAINYFSGDKINFHFLYPTEKPTIDANKNVYKNNFGVTNTGSLESLLDIKIEIKKDEFKDGTLRYSLYNGDEVEVSEGYIKSILSQDGRLLSTIATGLELKNNETENYTLLIWIEEKGIDQSEEMKKKFIGTIIVEANQKRY